MRYAGLFNKASKNRTDTEKEALTKAFTAINEECDKFSHYIHDVSVFDLLKVLVECHDKRILLEVKEIKCYDINRVHFINTEYQNELEGVIDTIFKEKKSSFRPSAVKKTHPMKLYMAYRALYFFEQLILEPLAANNPCEVKWNGKHIWLDYPPEFITNDTIIQKKLFQEEMQVHVEADIWLKLNPDYYQMTLTDEFVNAKMEGLRLRAPWVFAATEGLEEYAKNNLSLSRIVVWL